MGTTPHRHDYNLLKELGVKLVINMRAGKKVRRIKTLPMPIVWVPTLDSRFFPIKPSRLIQAVGLCQNVIRDSGKIYVFCRVGRHRSLVMCAAILISQGYTAEEAMHLIKSKRAAADPNASHIKKAVYRFEKWWLDSTH